MERGASADWAAEPVVTLGLAARQFFLRKVAGEIPVLRRVLAGSPRVASLRRMQPPAAQVEHFLRAVLEPVAAELPVPSELGRMVVLRARTVELGAAVRVVAARPRVPRTPPAMDPLAAIIARGPRVGQVRPPEQVQDRVEQLVLAVVGDMAMRADQPRMAAMGARGQNGDPMAQAAAAVGAVGPKPRWLEPVAMVDSTVAGAVVLASRRWRALAAMGPKGLSSLPIDGCDFTNQSPTTAIHHNNSTKG